MNELGYGKDYKYAHSYEDNFVKQDYLPEKILKTQLYFPQKNPAEEKAKQLIIKRWGNKYK